MVEVVRHTHNLQITHRPPGPPWLFRGLNQRPFAMIDQRVTEKRWSAELHVSPVWRATADRKIGRNSSPSGFPEGLLPTCQMRCHMCRTVRERMAVDGVLWLCRWSRIARTPLPSPQRKQSIGRAISAIRYSGQVELNRTWHLLSQHLDIFCHQHVCWSRLASSQRKQ